MKATIFANDGSHLEVEDLDLQTNYVKFTMKGRKYLIPHTSVKIIEVEG